MITKPSMCGLCSLARTLTDRFVSNLENSLPLRRFASQLVATWQPG